MMKIINGQRDHLEREVVNKVFDSFKPGATSSHTEIMTEIDRLEPRGKLSPVSKKNSLPLHEK